MSSYTAQNTRVIRISDYLIPGQENAVSLQGLAAILHLPSRTIRRMIEGERRRGVLICSDNRQGYFLAADKKEAEQFARSMRRRASEILETAKAIESAAEGLCPPLEV